MGKPWDILGDDIAEWAGRDGAAALLPELIRRLLLATTKLRQLTMRADGGTRLPGWDGLTDIVDGPPFPPLGPAGWEISTGKGVREKADKDFAKRAKAAAPLDPARATFVAVTGRRFSGKLAWTEERRGQGPFADVRALDADDLATWLSMAPAVARWFAGQIGRPVDDVLDVEAFLKAWSTRTHPPLPHDLVLLGSDRKHAAAMVREWLGRPPGLARVLEIQASTREEAILFTAAVVAEATRERDALLASTLVVESREAFRALCEDESSCSC